MALTKVIGSGIGTVTDNVVMTSDDPTITMTDSSGTNDIVTIQATSGALIITARDGSADGEIIFKKTDGSATDESMRIRADGIVGIGQSGDDPVFDNNVGVSIGSNNGSALAGVGQFACSGGVALRASRTNEKGATIAIHDQGTQRATLGTVSTADVYFGCDRGGGLRISDQELIPCNASGAFNNDAVDLGHASSFFDDIRATNGTIVTSDKNYKQDIEELTEKEKKVAVACKGLLRKFRFKSSVTKKGDNARTHFGIIAQDLQDAFTAEGLDANKYAMFCSDTWWEKDGEVYMVETEAPSDATKNTRLSVRYTELLAFIISAI